MNRYSIFSLLLISFLSINSLSAQFTSAGTEFYFSYIQNRIDQNGAPTNCLLHEVNISYYIANNTSQTALIEVDFYGSNIDYLINGVTIITGNLSNVHQFSLLPDEAIQIEALPTTTITFNDPCPGASTTTIPDVRDLMLMDNGQISSKVYCVKSLNNKNITVFAESSQFVSRDASLVLPLESLGYSYYVSSIAPEPLEYSTVHYGQNLGGPAEIGIVSTYDNSIINFKLPPSVSLASIAYSNVDGTSNVSINGGVVHTITLNKGEAYQIQSDNFDLTGTNIWTSNYPFAVFSGNMAGQIIGSSSYSVNSFDHVYEQMFPVKYWGNEYLITPYINDESDLLKIVGLNDSTHVYKNGVLLGIVNAGESIDIDVLPMESMFITTDVHNIMVGQFLKSSFYNGVTHVKYDPCMTIIPSVSQSISEITFSALPELDYSSVNCTDNVKEDYVNIVAHNSEMSQILIDDFINGPVTLQNFSSVVVPWTQITGNTDYSYCILDVSNNSITQSIPYHLYFNGQSNYGFNAIVYGLDCGEAYSYAAGINIIVDTLSMDTLVADFYYVDSLCVGDLCDFSSSANLTLDSALWNFDDPASGNDNHSTFLNPNHIFLNSGSYNVELIAYSGNLTDTVNQIIEVYPLPDIDLGNDTIYVLSFPVILNVSCAGCTYLWSTGEIDSTIQVYSNGLYSVTAISNYGCVNSDTVLVVNDDNIDDIENGFGIQVFPVPCSNYINIKCNKEIIRKIEIFNSIGIMVHEEEILDNFYRIEISNSLPNGIYYIGIDINEEVYFRPIVLLR